MRSPILFFLVFLLVLPASAAPTILVTSFDPNNVSCNSEFILSNLTSENNITYIQYNVTSGNVYKIYDPFTLAVYGNATATADNATITAEHIVNGTYRVAETGQERILFTYWNAGNSSCNGIFQIWNSTPVTNVRLVLSNVTPNTRYSLIEPLSHVTRGWGIATANATIDVKGLQDGVYWIVGDSNSSFVNPVIIGVAFVGAAFVGASFINRWYQKRKGA